MKGDNQIKNNCLHSTLVDKGFFLQKNSYQMYAGKCSLRNLWLCTEVCIFEHCQISLFPLLEFVRKLN